MPTYEYRCPKCGHAYEKLQNMSDDSRAKCPECGTRGERVITGGGGVIFKGSGFYLTDYGRAGQKKQADKADKAEKAEKTEKTEKTETTPKADKPADKPKKTKPKGDS